MAGLYPDAPGPQIMYDKDGSAGFYIPAGSTTPQAWSQATLTSLNDVSDSGLDEGTAQSGGPLMGVIFPELRDIVGYFIAHSVTGAGNPVGVYNLATSTNTTNGYDGTWTVQNANPAYSSSMIPGGWRSPTTVAYNGIIAIRYNPQQTGGAANAGSVSYGFHIYGKQSSGAAVDRLRLWDPVSNVELTGPAFDFGSFGRNTTQTKTFRVRNNSATLSATSIVLSTEALANDATPAVAGQTTLSQGAGFASTQNIGTLAAGATSAVCSVQIAATASEQLGVLRQRIIATAASFV